MSGITHIPFLPGTYRGTGIWHDRTNAIGTYTVEHRYEALPHGSMLQTTHRIFMNDDGSVQYEEHSTIEFTPEEYPFLRISLSSAGAVMHGSGYCYSNLLHYDLIISETNSLENTYLVDGDMLRLAGSASNNGKPTVWEERSQAAE